MIDEKMMDRFAGALLGLAVGDALGTTLEFAPRTTTGEPPHTEMVGGGPFNMKPGEWTDDTSMACCLAESIVTRKGFDERDQLERYVRWMDEGHWSVKGRCFDIGGTTSRALNRFKRTGHVWAGKGTENDNANGSLMRLAPLPMAWFRQSSEFVADLAAKSSRTTHGGAEAEAACRLWAVLIADAIKGQDDPGRYIGKVPAEAYTLRSRVYRATQGHTVGTDTPATGYALDGVELALTALCSTTTFEAGLVAVVNQGGDADTNGAIYGQLAGAVYGASRIPARWITKLAWRNKLEDLTVDLWKFAKGGK